MKKLTKRILSVFLIALLVCTLLPMGAFAEEVAEPQNEEAAEQKAVVVDEIDTYASTGHEKQTATFYVLYISDDFTLGYDYNNTAKWDVDYECQYSQCGSGSYNHSMKLSDITAQKTKAASYITDPDYEIVGWSKEAKANPTIFDFKYSGTTATQTSYTIYIVAKKTTPPVVNTTFTVNYMDGTSKFDTDSKTSEGSSASFTVISATPTNEGYTFTGWEDIQGNAYTGTFTLSADTPTAVAGNNSVTLDLYAQWEKNAPAENTFIVNYYEDKDSTTLFETDTKTSEGSSANFTVITAVPTKDGYTFNCWVDASDTRYENPFTLDANTANAVANDKGGYTLNLYATWAGPTTPPTPDEKTFTVNYIDNDENGTKAADSQTAKGTESADFTTRTLTEVYDSIIAAHPDQELVGWKDPADKEYSLGGGITMVAPTYELTLIAVWKDKGGTGGDEPTPPTPGEKVSEPGMLKTVDGKTGEAIGTRHRGDVIDFQLDTTVGEDMMWTKDENNEKVQRLTQDKETGLWGGATYNLVVTDTISANMTIDYTSVAVTINGTDVTSKSYVSLVPGTNGFVLTIDCVEALNDGIFTVGDIGSAAVVITYKATVNEDAQDGEELRNSAKVNNSTESVVTGDVTVPVTPPSTGGNGTRMFTIGGVLILAAACVLFAVSRKKTKD